MPGYSDSEGDATYILGKLDANTQTLEGEMAEINKKKATLEAQDGKINDALYGRDKSLSITPDSALRTHPHAYSTLLDVIAAGVLALQFRLTAIQKTLERRAPQNIHVNQLPSIS